MLFKRLGIDLGTANFLVYLARPTLALGFLVLFIHASCCGFLAGEPI
jgi:hypothetical protein